MRAVYMPLNAIVSPPVLARLSPETKFGATLPKPGLSNTGKSTRKEWDVGIIIRRLLIAAAPFLWRKYRNRSKRKKDGADRSGGRR